MFDAVAEVKVRGDVRNTDDEDYGHSSNVSHTRSDSLRVRSVLSLKSYQKVTCHNDLWHLTWLGTLDFGVWQVHIQICSRLWPLTVFGF